MTNLRKSPLRFLPVILVCLGLIAFGLYKTYYPIIDARKSVISDYYNPNYALQPTTNPQASGSAETKVIPTINEEGKISSAILNTSCKLLVITDIKDFSVTTEGLSGQCKNESFGKISTSGNMLVFTGNFGGSTSLLKLFTLTYEKTVTLGSWKDGQIQDYIFMSNNNLAVLVDGARETTLEIYDINGINKDFSSVYNPSVNFINPGKWRGSIVMDNRQGVALNNKGNKVQVLGEEKNIIFQAEPMEIFMNSKLTTISPSKAVEMAFNLYKETENGLGSKGIFDQNGSNDKEWKVDILNNAGGVVKQYMVNNKTGEII